MDIEQLYIIYVALLRLNKLKYIILWTNLRQWRWCCLIFSSSSRKVSSAHTHTHTEKNILCVISLCCFSTGCDVWVAWQVTLSYPVNEFGLTLFVLLQIPDNLVEFVYFAALVLYHTSVKLVFYKPGLSQNFFTNCLHELSIWR